MVHRLVVSDYTNDGRDSNSRHSSNFIIQPPSVANRDTEEEQDQCTLSLGDDHSTELRVVDLQNNNISSYTKRPGDLSIQLVLVQNPFCAASVEQERSCSPPQKPNISYTTQQNCGSVICNSNELSSPNWKCAFPYVGTLVFRSTKFSDYSNSTYYRALEQTLISTFQSHQAPVDNVSLSNIRETPSNYLEMALAIFPLGKDRFNRREISDIGFILSNQIFKPPSNYGPYYFIGFDYTAFADEPVVGTKKKLTIGAIIGIAVGGTATVLIVMYLGATLCCCKKRSSKTAEVANPSGFASSASWTNPMSSSGNLKFKGSKSLSLEEIKRVTNNFSEANEIGSGSYGKVYRGTLIDGQLVAVKRGDQGSRNRSVEFITEVELLSRVHHKNLVSLLGFCFEKEELILVYEYVPNGTLNESLSGKSGIRLDWRRRIKVALGAARGLAYLHELANPPIVHRDIKSNNILLDENLNAKVSDFGLSKSLFDDGSSHIITEVKGTMGYMDPEYYMTHKLNEKSDVYSFGILMLELTTGKPPIDKGQYILRQMNNIIDRKQDLYGLHELLDPTITLDTALKGFEKYVDLALRCVEESGANRPAMGEVVKQLEDIQEMAGMDPDSDSATSSATFVNRNLRHLYGDESLSSHYSAALPR